MCNIGIGPHWDFQRPTCHTESKSEIGFKNFNSHMLAKLNLAKFKLVLKCVEIQLAKINPPGWWWTLMLVNISALIWYVMLHVTFTCEWCYFILFSIICSWFSNYTVSLHTLVQVILLATSTPLFYKNPFSFNYSVSHTISQKQSSVLVRIFP